MRARSHVQLLVRDPPAARPDVDCHYTYMQDIHMRAAGPSTSSHSSESCNRVHWRGNAGTARETIHQLGRPGAIRTSKTSCTSQTHIKFSMYFVGGLIYPTSRTNAVLTLPSTATCLITPRLPPRRGFWHASLTGQLPHSGHHHPLR
jgi:hypothetical protein